MNFADLMFWKAPAPPIGDAFPRVPPSGAMNDMLGSAHQAETYQTERVSWHEQHAERGSLPKWVYRQPPGVGDAPQHVWATYSLARISIDGPGDRPATYLRSVGPPLGFTQFAMRWQGMGVDGGNFALTGLYTPQPLAAVATNVFAGWG